MSARSVLITGCSSGIGRSLAFGLHARGYRVFAAVRRPEDVAALVAAGVESMPLDLASSESIQHAVDDMLARTGNELYGLVNNGAYAQPGAVEDLSRAALRAQFETNLFGTHELTARLLPVFRAANAGRIIQISSILGLICLPYRGAYNASKYALEALSDTLRLELRDTHIRVCLIEPGPIDTSLREKSMVAFASRVDRQRSAHRDRYEVLLRRLAAPGRTRFALPPEAVLKRVIHALEAPRPRIRYYVTFPTYLFAVLRRVLPARVLDRVLYAVGGRGRR